MPSNVTDILKGVVGELREIAKSETVIGEPVTVGERTVIPVVKISFGFGAGGGEGASEKTSSGFGGGGGGGAKIEPAAFIILEKDEVKLLPAGKGKWDTIIDAIPDFAKKIQKMAEKFKSDNKEEDDESGDKNDHTSDDPESKTD